MAFSNQIRSEVEIEGTAEEAWAVLSDFASYGEWNPGFARIEGRAEAGTRLTITFALNGGRTMTMRPRVLVAEPGGELRWLGRLFLPWVFDGEHRFELHEDEPGRVRFVQGERFRGLLVPFLRRMIEVDTLATFERVNAALAARVEELRRRREVA
ncbi:MAG: SRPBCC family protein [Planctomycetaceae bacterium]